MTRIAGVSVNEKNLPPKDDLIKKALTHRDYVNLPKKKAVELINAEIKESGLFKKVSVPATEPNSKD